MMLQTKWMQMTILMTRMIRSKLAIIITAAGSSTRIGGGIKKEYLPYKNGTVLSSCAQTFLNACSRDFEITDFIVTCPKGGREECEKALQSVNADCFAALAMTEKNRSEMTDGRLPEIIIVEGADTRQKSVYNGLLAVKGEPDLVLIHDGARPFISEELIRTTIKTAAEFGAAVPGLTPTDTQKEINEDGFIVRHLVRSSLCAVQTPQGFEFSRLLAAHERAALDGHEYTDDTEIWGAYCGRVKVVSGEVNNIKITYPADLEKLS